MPTLFYSPMPHFHTSTGELANGYKLFFYSPGTTTKKDTYTTSAMSVANSNPVVLNSRGESTNDIYLNGAYKVVLAPDTDSDPPVASIKTIDNVTSLQQLYTTLAKTSDYTVTAADKDKWILVDATSGAVTITLLAAATAGDGFSIGIKKIDTSSNAVTIDGNASETIDTSLTLKLYTLGDGVRLTTNATSWYTGESHPQTLTDTNGNEVVKLGTTAAAVNEITVTNSATGSSPTIAATGGDTNVDLNFQGKGDTAYNFYGTSTTAARIRLLENTSNGGNFITITAPSSLTANRAILLPDHDLLLTTYGARASRSTAQTISHNTLTKISLDTEEWDAQGNFDSASNYRFTVPSGAAGKYLICGSLIYETANSTVRWSQTQIYKNGAEVAGLTVSSSMDSSATATIEGIATSGVLDLVATDYIELYTYQSNTGTAARNVDEASLSIIRIGT